MKAIKVIKEVTEIMQWNFALIFRMEDDGRR